MATQYRTLPSDLGTPGNPIRLPFNVARYHIKKTTNKKDFILGNAIVTDRYISTICMITDLEPKGDSPDTFKVILTDGTGKFAHPNINKSQFSPGVWARLCGYSNVKASKNKPYNRNKYLTSKYYPIIVKFVFELGNVAWRDNPTRRWHSCTLFGITTSPGNQPKPESEEWYNIIRQHNIEKSIAFYEEYCLTSQEQLSLDLDLTLQTNNNNILNNNKNNNNMSQQPVPAYHRILDNPCCPIPMTIDNMWNNTNPIQDKKQQDKPKLLYYGRDITNRITHLTLYVRNNTKPCPDTPQCSADCKRVDFRDNSTNAIIYHLSKYPPKGSTCYHLCRIHVNTSDGEHSTGSNTMGRFTIGNEGYKNQQLLDEHEKKAKEVINIQEIIIINKQTKEYCELLKEEYNKHLEQVKHLYMIITSRLSTYPLFATLIEPLQKQLEDVMTKSKEEYQQCDTPESLSKLLDWNNIASDLLMNCKQIIDTLLNTDIALYTDFFDYYLPHLDEQLHHLEQQMEVHLISNPSIIHDSSPSSSSSSQHHMLDSYEAHSDNDTSDFDEDNYDMFNYDEDQYDEEDEDGVEQYDDDDSIASTMAELPTTTTSSPTTILPITTSSTLFNYQRNVIRPIAHYRYTRGHVIPPSSASLTLLHDVGALNITLSSSHTINNSTENGRNNNIPHHQQIVVHQQQNQQQQDNTNILSLAQQHALQLSSTRQNLLLHAVDYEHALIDIKDDEIIELRKQIKDLQDSNSTTRTTSTSTTGGSSFDNTSTQSHHLMYESHIKIYQQQLESKDKQLEAKDKQLEAKDKQLEFLHQHYNAQLELKDKQRQLELEAKDRELALLRQLLQNSNQK